MTKTQKQQEYRVRWEIDIDAETPEEAAREARKCIQDPGSIATIFSVVDKDGRETTVDLEHYDADAPTGQDQ
jgi:hypothetical protein